MYVDGGASSEILYEHCFNLLQLEIKKQMVPATIYLVGFSGEIIWPLGQVSMLVKIGNEEHSTSAWMNFMVVRSHSLYNGIIGRPCVRKIKAIPSTAHRMLKFPVTGGTVTLRSSVIIPLECAMILRPRTQQPVEGRKKLYELLMQNLDIFAWKPADMTRVLRHIAKHRLNLWEGCFPVRQKKRGKSSERNKAICEEVEKLVNADFKDMNKACPKDGYPLPKIDWKVESLCGYPFKCFLDAYKGYHQIKMAKEDEEKTASICSYHVDTHVLPLIKFLNRSLHDIRSSSSSYRQTFASKIDQLYEISYVPDDSRIPAPVRSTSALKFVRHENGLVEIKFSSSQPKSDNVFPTGIHMITPIDQEPAQEIKHIWWEVCNCESYLDEAAKIDDDDEDPPKKRNPTEATLNWQSENAIAQNKFLVKILSQQGMITNSQEYLSSRVRSLESIINELRFKIQELHQEIIQIIRTSPTTQPSSSITQKEAKMKNLKNQLHDLERQHKQKRITSLIDESNGRFLSPLSVRTKKGLIHPQKGANLLHKNHNHCCVDCFIHINHDLLSDSKMNPVSMFLNSLTQIDKPQNTQFIAPIIKPQKDYEEFDNVESFKHLFMAKPKNTESTVQFDAEDYEEHKNPKTKRDSHRVPKVRHNQYFTFETIPPSNMEMTRCIADAIVVYCRIVVLYH
ncbi:reverse transcriptase domain-containing protein [Tanacetum coccineum]